jgi:hypothetical protein
VRFGGAGIVRRRHAAVRGSNWGRFAVVFFFARVFAVWGGKPSGCANPVAFTASVRALLLARETSRGGELLCSVLTLQYPGVVRCCWYRTPAKKIFFTAAGCWCG